MILIVSFQCDTKIASKNVVFETRRKMKMNLHNLSIDGWRYKKERTEEKYHNAFKIFYFQ